VQAVSLTRMRERLEANGLVALSLDPSDRRRIVVEMTDAGRQVPGGLDFWRQPLVTALHAMSDAERMHFAQMVSCLRQHLNSQEGAEHPNR